MTIWLFYIAAFTLDQNTIGLLHRMVIAIIGYTQAKTECTNSECRAKTTAGSFVHAVKAYKWQAHG